MFTKDVCFPLDHQYLANHSAVAVQCSLTALTKSLALLLVHGNYSDWSEFRACSVSCGGGNATRYRTCTNPRPLFGGRNCSRFGANMETIPCNVLQCPSKSRDIIFSALNSKLIWLANLPDVKRRMYQRKVDVNMWNAVKSVLAKHTLYGVQHIHINLTLMHSTFYRYADADPN